MGRTPPANTACPRIDRWQAISCCLRLDDGPAHSLGEDLALDKATGPLLLDAAPAGEPQLMIRCSIRPGPVLARARLARDVVHRRGATGAVTIRHFFAVAGEHRNRSAARCNATPIPDLHTYFTTHAVHDLSQNCRIDRKLLPPEAVAGHIPPLGWPSPRSRRHRFGTHSSQTTSCAGAWPGGRAPAQRG